MEYTVTDVMSRNIPRYIRDIEITIADKTKLIKKLCNEELIETQQLHHDQVLEIYREAFNKLINKTITYVNLLNGIKEAYENAIQIRNERINQLTTQDRVFGITARKNDLEDKIKDVLKENDKMKEKNLKLTLEVSKLKKDMGKLQDDKFTDYLTLMKERDARYTLYFENLGLHLKMKELDGSVWPTAEPCGDPLVLRIALDRCREQLSATQRELRSRKEEYADTVPRTRFDLLETKHRHLGKALADLENNYHILQEKHNQLLELKRCLEEEATECRERCTELSRIGTPRPEWEECGEYVAGGRERWRREAGGRSSRDSLRVLLQELGPAPDSDRVHYFHGLGLDPMIPPYLRYEGKVRNLRLSRKEIAVIINDIWSSKINGGQDLSMEEFVTKYFEDRYQQPIVRAEWAYNLCSGAEQMLDDPQVKLFWGVLHGHLSEEIYTAHRQQWCTLRDNLYNKHMENVTVEEFEKISKSTFPLKNEVDIKNMTDAVRKQLKIKLNSNEINLDKLFQEREEGLVSCELSQELYRQRRAAQDRYLREVVAALGAGAGVRGNRRAPVGGVTVHALRRAFAIVDPAIDHIVMDKYIRWAFSAPTGSLETLPPLPLSALTVRLAAGHVARVGPRHSRSHRAPRTQRI